MDANRVGRIQPSEIADAGPMDSVRVPVLPSNRAYLRALREAEEVVWTTPAHPTIKPAVDSFRPLRDALAEERRELRREGWYFALIAVLSGIAVGWSIATSMRLAQNWDEFARAIQKLLG